MYPRLQIHPQAVMLGPGRQHGTVEHPLSFVSALNHCLSCSLLTRLTLLRRPHLTGRTWHKPPHVSTGVEVRLRTFTRVSVSVAEAFPHWATRDVPPKSSRRVYLAALGLGYHRPTAPQFGARHHQNLNRPTCSCHQEHASSISHNVKCCTISLLIEF